MALLCVFALYLLLSAISAQDQNECIYDKKQLISMDMCDIDPGNIAINSVKTGVDVTARPNRVTYEVRGFNFCEGSTNPANLTFAKVLEHEDKKCSKPSNELNLYGSNYIEFNADKCKNFLKECMVYSFTASQTSNCNKTFDYRFVIVNCKFIIVF